MQCHRSTVVSVVLNNCVKHFMIVKSFLQPYECQVHVGWQSVTQANDVEDTPNPPTPPPDFPCTDNKSSMVS